MTDLLDHAFQQIQKNEDFTVYVKDAFKKIFPKSSCPSTQKDFKQNISKIQIIMSLETLPGKFFLQVSVLINVIKFNFSFLSESGDFIRIKSQHQRSNLMRKFTSLIQYVGSWKINSVNGQVNFMISVFLNKKTLQNLQVKIEQIIKHVQVVLSQERQKISLVHSYYKAYQQFVQTPNSKCSDISVSQLDCFQNSECESSIKSSINQKSYPYSQPQSSSLSSYSQFLKYCTKQFELSRHMEVQTQSNKSNNVNEEDQEVFGSIQTKQIKVEQTIRQEFNNFYQSQNQNQVRNQSQSQNQSQNQNNPQKDNISKINLKEFQQYFLSVKAWQQLDSYGNHKERNFKKNIYEYMQLIENSFLKPLTSNMKNYQKLNLTKKNQAQLSSEIGTMKIHRKTSAIVKVKDQIYGTLRVQIKEIGYQNNNKLYSYMKGLLSQGKEILFFDNYFKFDQKFAEGITISLALNKLDATKFFQSNSQCISFSTKMKIFSQLVSCSQILWKKLDTFVPNLCISSFSVTKSIGVKLDSSKCIPQMKKFDKQQKYECKRQIQLKLIQTNLNLARIFFRIFFDYHLMYYRSNYKSQKSLRFFKQNNRFPKLMLQKIRNNIQIFGPYYELNSLTHQFLDIVAEPLKNWKQMQSHDNKWMISSVIKVLQRSS